MVFWIHGFEESGDYLFVYQRCCKTEGLTNLVNSGVDGTTLMLEISYQNGTVVCNDSPQFSDDIFLSVEVGTSFNLNLPITESDGDSLEKASSTKE